MECLKLFTQLSTTCLLQKVSKEVWLVQWPLFNISGKLKPTCLVLDAEVVLVKYPVNVLVSIPEHLRNSLNQQETVSVDTGLCRLILLMRSCVVFLLFKDLWSTGIAQHFWLHKALLLQTPLIQMMEDFYRLSTS